MGGHAEVLKVFLSLTFFVYVICAVRVRLRVYVQFRVCCMYLGGWSARTRGTGTRQSQIRPCQISPANSFSKVVYLCSCQCAPVPCPVSCEGVGL